MVEKKLFMADLLSNWLYEKIKIYITKKGLDVQFSKKTPLEMIIGQQVKKEKHDQNY